MFISTNGVICLEHISKERPQRQGFKGRTIGSLVSFVGANGLVYMSVWIFKAKISSDESEEDDEGLAQADFTLLVKDNILRSNWPRFYVFSKSGYSNKKIHSNIMAKFGEIWKHCEPKHYCWLFGDQLAAHKTADIVKNSLADGVMCWLLPANTSHFLQLLDDKVFARFKQILYSFGRKLSATAKIKSRGAYSSTIQSWL